MLSELYVEDKFFLEFSEEKTSTESRDGNIKSE